MNIGNSGKLKVESEKRNACYRFGFLFLLSTFYFLLSTFLAFAANMDPSNHWAWNDATSWIDVAGLTVGDTTIVGKATSGVGDIYFNAASYPGTLPPGVTWGVTNDGAGNLSGFAWNDAIGWISFWCGNGGASCASSNYRATINASSGEFSGYAWNDIIGWISFWCGNGGGSCSAPAISYRTNTTWRPPAAITGSLDSSVFDTGTTATFNAVLWHGNLNGGSVQFRIASSNNIAGPWSFVGPNNDLTGYYSDLPGKTIPLVTADHAGKRYVRYRIFLTSSVGLSPRVNDVIINWSR